MAASDKFYLDLVEEVNEVLEEFGKLYNIRGPQNYDEATMTTTPGTSRSGIGIVSEQGQKFNLGSQIFLVSEASSSWADKRTLILPASVNPLPGEEVEVDGEWFPLSGVKAIKPADIVVVYILDISL